ncbi:hypothetical protein [Brachyspira hyodysenteriae]|uniref:VSH-1 phage-like protein n=1 Tax=Brachyspira hyodysenteriae ATCC 27164 TaxID=1266923 RepID=A0A3B6VTZ9_BRAHO|nr:hypothetical protein [Brachyspira hyodysenteriae]ANN64639.1 hypothetical protein BHYOB78_12440 [Brachyspira hyodysenteriae ATCC 27164]MCZ9924198.1 hypothetical protein [Brachyspira hyodysenteriae]
MITSTMFFSFFRTKLGKRIIAAVIIALVVFVCFSVIAYKNNTIRQKEKEIAQYQENIKGLELQTQTLQNEILFIKENEKFQNSFSNSDTMIKSIDQEKLTRTEYETFNSISNNFYKYFNSINFMQYKNKICQSTAFYTARNIYYKVSNKSSGFNEEVSGKYYKNRRMADLVQCTSRHKLLLI